MLKVVTMLTHNDPRKAGAHGGNDFWKQWGVEYVRRFFAAADRGIKEDYIPFILTNVPELVHDMAVPLLVDTERAPGWWAKLELFNPHHRLEGRTLFCDLDNIVGGDMTPILDLWDDETYWALDDLVDPGRFNSSTMYCDPSRHVDIWDRFRFNPGKVIAEYTHWPHASDQAFIWDMLREKHHRIRLMQDALPKGLILNARLELEKGADWRDTRLVYGSWRPKPHESTHPFYKEHWSV